MKQLAWLSGTAGLLVAIILIAHQGVADVARLLAQGGWPLFLLVPLHAVPLLLDAQGWRTLLIAGPARRVNLGFLWWVASVREAVSRLLPTLGVGGELAGLRLARLRLHDNTAVAASIVVELMLTLFAQYVFAVLGVLMVPAAMQDGGHGWMVLAGLLLSLPVPVLFALTLRHHALFERLEGVTHRLFGAGHPIAAMVDGARLDARIRALIARRPVLLKALGWQLAGLVAGASEVWFALMRLGYPATFSQALAIEALSHAARQMAFFVPAGLGVLEAALLLLGGMLGVSPQVPLSLALIKRSRELLFGIPALLTWQWVELRQWRRAGKRRRGGHGPTAGTP
jgi:putative membrane protein